LVLLGDDGTNEVDSPRGGRGGWVFPTNAKRGVLDFLYSCERKEIHKVCMHNTDTYVYMNRICELRFVRMR